MSQAAFVAGDWGTSHLRLFLCLGSEVLDSREGPGIGAAGADPANVLFELVAPWTSAHGRLPMWFAGMIGSRNGWREAPYVPCPADEAALAAAMLRFSARGHAVTIAPGLSCTNLRGAPDFMRGEETQIVGALARHPQLASGRHVAVLPGTHTKWVSLDDGCIQIFHTSLSGELYALLRDHSMLLRVPAAMRTAASGEDEQLGFELGLSRSREHASTPLPHLLFEVRSRQLAAGLNREQARGFLSGLIVGSDVLGGLSEFRSSMSSGSKVAVIGTSDLTRAYRAALASHGFDALIADGNELALAGLQVLAGRAHHGDAQIAAIT